MTDNPTNETYNRILEAAGDLFALRGFSAVTLRDIGKAVNIHHASLYYYAPDGKEQLFVEVMRRNFETHRMGILKALSTAGDDIGAQLNAAALWLLSQSPLDLNRMAHADLPKLKPEHALSLMTLAYDTLHQPLIEAFDTARSRGQIRFKDSMLAALSFISLIDGLRAVPAEFRSGNDVKTVATLVDMLLYGWKNA